MLARALGVYGVPRSGIAKMIGIDVKTLNKHYGPMIQNSRMEMGATAISVIYKGMNSRTESIALTPHLLPDELKRQIPVYSPNIRKLRALLLDDPHLPQRL